MSLQVFTLQDVTGDPAAQARARHAPALAYVLENLGFCPVGLLRSRAQDPGWIHALRKGMHPEDAAEMVAIAGQADVIEVWNSPDHLAFATVERFLGGSIITLRSILDNGAVIETAMRPVRGPRPPLPPREPLPWLAWQALRLVLGDPPLWPRQDRPAAGFHVMLVETRSLEDLWRQHTGRVEEILAGYGTRISPHNTLPHFRAIRSRFEQVTHHYGRVGARALKVVGNIWTILFMAGIGMLCVAARSVGWLVADLLLTLALLVLVVPVMALTNRVIVPRIGAPLVPLATLVLRACKKG